MNDTNHINEEGFHPENPVSEKEERRLELERSFQPQNLKIVRKELFANLRDPAVSIRDGSITFNTACINGLENVVYVNLMIDEEEGLLAVHGCDENDKHALRWCISKPDKRKTRKMSCPGFTDLLYKVMGWDKKYRYKILGYQIKFDDEIYYVFDLKITRIFQAKTEDSAAEELPENETKKMKGYYPDDIANTFGVTMEEYKRETAVTEVDGFVSMAMLTGVRRDRNAAGSEMLSSKEGGAAEKPVDQKPEILQEAEQGDIYESVR